MDAKRARDRIISAFVDGNTDDANAIEERLALTAFRGMDSPETLTKRDIQQVCFALSLHLAMSESASHAIRRCGQVSAGEIKSICGGYMGEAEPSADKPQP